MGCHPQQFVPASELESVPEDGGPGPYGRPHFRLSPVPSCGAGPHGFNVGSRQPALSGASVAGLGPARGASTPHSQGAKNISFCHPFCPRVQGLPCPFSGPQGSAPPVIWGPVPLWASPPAGPQTCPGTPPYCARPRARARSSKGLVSTSVKWVLRPGAENGNWPGARREAVCWEDFSKTPRETTEEQGRGGLADTRHWRWGLWGPLGPWGGRAEISSASGISDLQFRDSRLRKSE